MSEKDNELEEEFIFDEEGLRYFSGVAYVFNEKQVSLIEGTDEAFPKGYGESEMYPDRTLDEIPNMEICITRKQLDLIEEQRKALNLEWDACLARIVARGFAAVLAEGLDA